MAKEKEKEKKPYVSLDGVDYTEDQLDDNQKLMVQHYNDLTRKINTSTFNLQQLQFGRQAFVDALSASLAAPDTDNEKPIEAEPVEEKPSTTNEEKVEEEESKDEGLDKYSKNVQKRINSASARGKNSFHHLSLHFHHN